MKELSPVQRCKVNKWTIGTLLKVIVKDNYLSIAFFRITAIGENDILIKQIFNPYDKITSGEIIAPFHDPHYTAWRKTSQKRVNSYFAL